MPYSQNNTNKFSVHFFLTTFKLEGLLVAKCLVKQVKLFYSVAPYSRQVICCAMWSHACII